MAALGAQSIASSYEQLLHVDADGGGNTTTHVSVKDGDNGTTFGFTIASDALMMSSTNRLEFGDTGTYIHQSADGVLDLVSDTEIELTATTIDINGAVAMNGAITGGTNITISGELDAATLDISGNADIDGTTNLDAVDIDGAVDMASTLTLAGNADFNGDLDVDGTANFDNTDIDGTLNVSGTTLSTGVISVGATSAVGIGVTTADTNVTELGTGHINLGRDDTADAKQLLFSKNGAIHSYFETTTTGLKLGAGSGELGNLIIDDNDIVFGTAGKGICLGVTSNTDSNTLDDYEEGLWTPTLTNITIGNGTTTATYTKIGRLVHVMCHIVWGSTTSFDGAVSISNLPFTTPQNTMPVSAYFFNANANYYPGFAYTVSNVINFRGANNNAASATEPFTWETSDELYFMATYED